ncbi:MAG: hypothetical protein SF187_23705 [Deltaproteobacteria bacterium]|nr:hypothetical protein [Deltaproteobacteria bacterium]
MVGRRNAEPPDLQFQIRLSSTMAGSVRMQFVPRPPLRSFYGVERKLAAVIYTLAAEFERRSERLNANWVVVAEPSSNQLVIELVDGDRFELALQFVQQTFGDFAIDHLIET